MLTAIECNWIPPVPPNLQPSCSPALVQSLPLNKDSMEYNDLDSLGEHGWLHEAALLGFMKPHRAASRSRAVWLRSRTVWLQFF